MHTYLPCTHPGKQCAKCRDPNKNNGNDDDDDVDLLLLRLLFLLLLLLHLVQAYTAFCTIKLGCKVLPEHTPARGCWDLGLGFWGLGFRFGV